MRPPLWQALAFGLIAGACGAAWILAEFTHKAREIVYHVPLAIVFTSALVDEAFLAVRTRRYSFFWGAALAGALIVGRMVDEWPISGHGILGAYLAATPIRPLYRACGAAIVVQATITKAFLGTPWVAVPYGAAVGLLIAWVARRSGETARSPQRT